MKTSTVVAGLGLAALLAGGAWWQWNKAQAATAAAAQPGAAAVGASGAGSAPAGPPVSVSTVRVEERDVVVDFEATGTVTSLNTVEVRPQVSSVITQVHVREGQFVRRGDLLFTLDARTDEVNLTKARAQLAKDEAALADARRQLARSRDLFQQNFVSQSAVDTNQTLVDSQQAVVASSQAAVAAAQVGLGYNRIVAQSAGRIGAINVFPGSLVQPTGIALLTITQLDPIAVSFNLPQRNLADALKGLREGGVPVSTLSPKLTGKLQFVDSAVDTTSGTVKVKAVFDNAAQALWPGAYVNVKMSVQTLKGATVVPQVAVITNQRGKAVYVVEGGKAAMRKVEVVYANGPDAVITGVKPGDKVVVDGRQNVRAGSTVVERAPGEGRGASRPGVGASGPAGRASGAGATP